MTATAHYSLLTMRPDAERVDVLCVGALVLMPNNAWHVFTPGRDKLEAIGYTAAAQRLTAMAANLKQMLDECDSLQDARAMLATLRSTLELHTFEGVFSFGNEPDFQRHIEAITRESISALPRATADKPTHPKPPRPRVHAKLRRHFADMGVLAAPGDMNAAHRVVQNYPIQPRHGLKAEFAIKNTVWHITETVDFEVAADGVRHKTYEAQAKCLVMHAAQDVFGPDTKRYIVVHGGGADHASSSIDLLSTVGDLFMTESDEDMTAYLDLIAKATGGTAQIGRGH